MVNQSQVEEQILINPDSFVAQQLRHQLTVGTRLRERWAKRHKRRNGKILLCICCMLGQHERCNQGDCPCPHEKQN